MPRHVSRHEASKRNSYYAETRRDTRHHSNAGDTRYCKTQAARHETRH